MRTICGLLLIVFFSPVSALAQWSPVGTAVGAHIGFSVGGDADGLIEERLGIQVLIPVTGPVEFGISVARFFKFPDVAEPGVTGSGGRMFVIGRIRPLGRSSVLSIGGGFTLGRFRREDSGTDVISWWESAAAAMLGVEAPMSRLRPFAELYVIAPGGASVLLGLNVRLY
jgi:hypothetical protein